MAKRKDKAPPSDSGPARSGGDVGKVVRVVNGFYKPLRLEREILAESPASYTIFVANMEVLVLKSNCVVIANSVAEWNASK
jgi:hypothetical protein